MFCQIWLIEDTRALRSMTDNSHRDISFQYEKNISEDKQSKARIRGAYSTDNPQSRSLSYVPVAHLQSVVQ